MKQKECLKQKLNSKTTLSSLTILRTNEKLLEEILSTANMKESFTKVMANKGCAGIDGMKIEEFENYLKLNWIAVKQKILAGSYKPSSILKIEIPKSNGGRRMLGIPTLLDRMIQQAILQVLQGYIDQYFSESSYGFRPQRSAQEAVLKSQEHIKSGRKYTVDIDLEKYFDTVNHDKLMSKLKRNIKDQRVLNLIRKYLNAGMNLNEDERVGVPQGSPLSPLLSNIYLHMLDSELEKRGHIFVRYADDCQIFVRSEMAAQRVMKSISKFLEAKLKLKINQQKSRIGEDCKFLGYIITDSELKISQNSLKKFKYNIKRLTRKAGGRRLTSVLRDLKPVINGWYEYFKYQTDLVLFDKLDKWIRRRLRSYEFRAMKTGANRLKKFLECKLSYDDAYKCAYTNSGPWKTSLAIGMSKLLNNNYLKKLGLVSLVR
jgi:RNA-directed DNA polymerase